MSNVVISGAAHGIGAALAGCCAGEGHAVAILDLDATAAKDRAVELERSGARALGIPCNVARAEACREAVGQVVDEWGGIDVLVNNAGITQLGRVVDTAVEVVHRVLAVNFFGAVHLTHAALPSLRERRGQVVAISSVAGFAPLACRAGYAASKHALEGWCATLRSEVERDGVDVTVVRPSFVHTDIGTRALGPDGRLAGADSRTGVGREIGADAAAAEILRGIVARRRVVWIGREARLAWWLSQLLPRVYERLMLRRTLD